RKPALLALGRPLKIVSDPAGLPYSVTDAYGRIHEGTTPAAVDAPWGVARVTISSPVADLPDWTRELAVDRGRETEARAVFAGAPLLISSIPTGLPFEMIRPDGSIQRGTTPADFERAAIGPALVRVSRPGWPALEQNIEIAAGQANTHAFEFVPGALTIQSTPAGATVSAGDRKLGVTPLTLAELIPGAHAYTVKLPGHVLARVDAEVRGGETTVSALTLAQSHELEKGNPHVVPELGLELMPIPSGTFLMGSTRLDPAHNSDEIQHEVVITRDFWLGKYEVTRAEWSAVMGTPAPKADAAKLPVTEISWDDAREFCRRLNERERVANRLPPGHEYALPTEAQWEYACRAGNIGLYGGVGGLGDLGWYQANSGGAVHPVGQKRANAWGLHDMHGNVWEWCADWFEFYPRDKVVDPVGPQAGPGRVYRGGGSGSAASSCRSASRLHSAPKDHTTNLGFRLALSPVAPAAK
ncbi:MAG: SUMF1/EgtB/PvdO family nonheme iron enzyme, partial [Burkholderiales bacterium]|nr:SUMF1/EgtB/PvdO family nonheme iron enzyme [Opitutaceae bacterium]